MFRRQFVSIAAVVCLLFSGCFGPQNVVYRSNAEEIILRSDGTFVYRWIISEAFREGTYEYVGDRYVLRFNSGGEFNLFETNIGNLVSDNGTIFVK